MKPIKLEIEGIKSFKDKAEIDFESLLSGGLFGIFGDTGSGKSTILNCMVIALYGKTNKNVASSDFVNTDRLSASVDYVFEICIDGERRRFEARREFYLKESRERKDVKAWLYEIKGKDKTVLADGVSKVDELIEDIVGLGKDEFEKCIALPQGEFASFVNAQRGERLKIIGRLFDLERYGDILSRKIHKDEENLSKIIEYERGRLEVLTNGQESIESLEKQVEEAQKDLENKNVKYSKNYDYIVKNSTFYDKQKQLDNLKLTLVKLEEKKEEFEIKREDLTVYHLAEKVVEESEIYIQKKKIRDSNSKELDAKNISYNDLVKSGESIKKNYEQIDNLYAKSSEIEAKIKRLDDIKQERENVAKSEKNLKEFDNTRKNAESKVISVNNDISSVSAEKVVVMTEYDAISIDGVLNSFTADFGSVALKSEYQNALNYFKKNYDYLVINDDNSATHNLYLHEFLIKVEEYTEKLKSVNSKDSENALSSLDELKSIVDKKDKLSKRLKELDDKLFNLNNLLVEQKSIISDCENKIKLSQNVIDEFYRKVKDIIGETDISLDEYYNRLLKTKDNIAKDVVSYKNSYEEYNKKVEDLKLEIVKLETSIKSDDTLLEQLVVKIKGMFNDKLTTYKQASELLSRCGSYDEFKKSVDDYYFDYNSVTKQVLSLTDELSKSDFNVEVYEKAVENNKELDELRKQSSENLVNLKNRLEKARQNAIDSSIIEINLKDYLYKLDNVSILYRLVKSQGLMEFVADEFLSEICAVAEVTLKKLTGGRFGLVYSDNFHVIDNFYGGATRAINTLSGGETFLVSLTLALALSQEIYAKSQRPIEFFFLDEGFGTLDENLVEIVLESLEKLKNSNFSIGVISHVAELKERIQSKILVSGATQTRGSTIKTETYNG